MKRMMLILVCLTTALLLAACATVDSSNSFQTDAPQEVVEATQAQDAQPTQTPTEAQPVATPSAEPGYNG